MNWGMIESIDEWMNERMNEWNEWLSELMD